MRPDFGSGWRWCQTRCAVGMSEGRVSVSCNLRQAPVVWSRKPAAARARARWGRHPCLPVRAASVPPVSLAEHTRKTGNTGQGCPANWQARMPAPPGWRRRQAACKKLRCAHERRARLECSTTDSVGESASHRPESSQGNSRWDRRSLPGQGFARPCGLGAHLGRFDAVGMGKKTTEPRRTQSGGDATHGARRLRPFTLRKSSRVRPCPHLPR